MKQLVGLADLARRVYWFLLRPRTRGAKCVIEHDGRWLLIRNTYGRRRWTFPGGRVRHREAPEQAARREALEEVGIALPDLMFIGSYRSRRDHHRDTVYCYMASVPTPDFRVDGTEVGEARWFAPASIPADHGPSVDRVQFMLAATRG